MTTKTMLTPRIKAVLAVGLGALGLMAVMVAGTSYASHDSGTSRDPREFTEVQRDAIAEARELRDAGDREGARQILEDANVFRALHIEHRVPTEEQRAKFEAIRTAVESNDYAAFQAAAGEYLAGKIESAEDFAKLVEANELRKAGDYRAAREIMKDLGFEHRLFRGAIQAHTNQ